MEEIVYTDPHMIDAAVEMAAQNYPESVEKRTLTPSVGGPIVCTILRRHFHGVQSVFGGDHRRRAVVHRIDKRIQFRRSGSTSSICSSSMCTRSL